MAESSNPPSPASPTPKGKRVPAFRWLTVGAVLVALLVGVTIAVAWGYGLRILVHRKALAFGVVLDFDAVELRRSSVRITNARATLVGVSGIKLRASLLRVGLEGYEPVSVAADGGVVSLEGGVRDRLPGLAAWSNDHPQIFRLSGAANEVFVELRGTATITPWLTVTGARVVANQNSGRFTASAGTLSGSPLGPVAFSWAVGPAQTLTFDLSRAERVLTLVLHTGQTPLRAHMTLLPTKLATLGVSVGRPLGTHVLASGTADLSIAGEGDAASVDGRADLRLHNWLPPHPKELNGIVSGKDTTIATKVHAGGDGAKVDLREVVLRAGRLTLKGGGAVDRVGDHGVVKLDLTGPVACAELAGNMVRDEFGDFLGGLAQEVTRRAVEGSATITVAIEVDSRDLGAAKVVPKVGLGCRVGLPGLGR